MSFPSPVGGIPLPSELPACIIFILLYVGLLPLVARTLRDKHSRTFVLFGITIMTVERIVVFILRAVQSRDKGFRYTGGVTNYQQTIFGLGIVTISTDLLAAFRCLLVNASYGPERYPESPSAETEGCLLEPPNAGNADRSRERFWIRRISDALLVLFLAALAIGIVANATYSDTLNNASKARRTYVCRYVSAAFVLFGIIAMCSATAWSCIKQPRTGKRGAITIGIISALVTVMVSYRLAVIGNNTAALDSMEPGSLNTPSSKALFYVFYALPEWISVALILKVNVRKTFGTGPFGDRRGHDETPKEKEKRLKLEETRRESRSSG